MALYLDRKPGEQILVRHADTYFWIAVDAIFRNHVTGVWETTLGLTAPQDTLIVRKELLTREDLERWPPPR